MERIGLLGGTFDPPHAGHLWLAETARQSLALDRVLFMPAGQPPHKAGRRLSPAHHRLAMVRQAVSGNAAFQIDETDYRRPAPHYTVTLLPLLEERYPEAAFWFLIGSDSLRDLPQWHRPVDVIAQCRLAVLPRPGVIVDWVTLSLAVPGIDHIVDYLAGPTLDLSSTQIRRWAADGRSLRYLLPPAVAAYVEKHRLYGPTAAAKMNV